MFNGFKNHDFDYHFVPGKFLQSLSIYLPEMIKLKLNEPHGHWRIQSFKVNVRPTRIHFMRNRCFPKSVLLEDTGKKHFLYHSHPIRFSFDVEFCQPILPNNQIFSLHHFNLRSLYFQSLQSLPNWIQLHTSETSPACTSFQ